MSRNNDYLKRYSSLGYSTHGANALNRDMGVSSAPSHHYYKSDRPKKPKVEYSRKPKFRYIQDEKANVSFLTAFTILFIFAGILLIIVTYATVANKRNNIISLNTELKNLQDSNLSFKSEISETFNIKDIEAAAKLLGMNKPKPYQIKYYSVPSESYVVQQNFKKATNEKFDLASLWKFIVREE